MTGHRAIVKSIMVVLALVLVVWTPFACSSREATTSTPVAQAAPILLPAPVDSSEALWGFIDSQGQWVIKPQFQNAYRFHDGVARVQVAGKWGYVNETGLLVVPAQFTEAHDFSDGLARVATGPTQDPNQTFQLFITASDYGFIDTTGKMVISATWKDAGDFSEGLAPVMQEMPSGEDPVGEDRCGYIDPKGRLVISLQFVTATGFSEGLAAVYGDEGWGYIDKTGGWAIKPMPNVLGTMSGVPDNDAISALNMPVRRFRSGFAPVGISEPPPDPDLSTGNWHFIDKTGKQAGWSQTFGQAGEFSEGLAPVKDNRSGKWGFIDTSGKAVIPAQFGEYPLGAEYYLPPSEGFHQGLAAAASMEGKVGYIDKTGNWTIQPRFAWGNGFIEGYAYVYAFPSNIIGEPMFLPGPLEIIDLTGRVIYKAPEPAGGSSTSSS